MRVYRTMLALSMCACASNSVGGTSTSTVRMAGVGGTVATLSMIAESDPVTTALMTTPEKAWLQVPGAYQDVGIPLSFSVPQTKIAGNQGTNLHRELTGVGLRNYFLCGDASGGPNADVYTIVLNIATQIQDGEGGSAKAATVLDATGIPMSSGSNSVHCGSTGELERRINDAIAKRVSGK
jgi:hypothetical protein